MLQWRTINGFPNYSVSNTGVVVNTKKNKTMVIYTRKGYCLVKLSSNGKSVEKKVHRLVAEAFIPNPNNYSCINHKDENPLNNSVENLEWCNHKYNNTYGTRIERQSKSLTENWRKRKAKNSSKDVDGTLALI